MPKTDVNKELKDIAIELKRRLDREKEETSYLTEERDQLVEELYEERRKILLYKTQIRDEYNKKLRIYKENLELSQDQRKNDICSRCSSLKLKLSKLESELIQKDEQYRQNLKMEQQEKQQLEKKLSYSYEKPSKTNDSKNNSTIVDQLKHTCAKLQQRELEIQQLRSKIQQFSTTQPSDFKDKYEIEITRLKQVHTQNIELLKQEIKTEVNLKYEERLKREIEILNEQKKEEFKKFEEELDKKYQQQIHRLKADFVNKLNLVTRKKKI